MKPQHVGVLLAISASLLFSTKAVFVKLAYQYPVDTITLLALRMLVALPIYLILLMVSGKTIFSISKKYWVAAIFAGLLGYYVASFLDFWGLQFVDASIERMILFTYPTFIVIISWLVWRKKITSRVSMALFVSYMGLLWVFSPNLGNFYISTDFWKGAAAILLCALAFASYMIMSQRIIPKFGPTKYTGLCMISACVAVLSHYSISNSYDHLFELERPVYFYAICMGILATVIPSYLMNFAIAKIGAAKAAIIASVGPISTITLAYILLGERMVWQQWIGALFIISSVTIISLEQKKKQSAKKPKLI